MRKRRVTRTVELRHELLVVRVQSAAGRFPCPVCSQQVKMLTVDEAAAVARLSAREIYRSVESGQLHFTEDQWGLLYVCAESLQRLTELRS